MANPWYKCPKCHSDNITNNEGIDPEGLYAEIDCMNCGFIWHETYEFVANYDTETGAELDDEGNPIENIILEPKAEKAE
jgi:uncharacterized Zn finger protein